MNWRYNRKDRGSEHSSGSFCVSKCKAGRRHWGRGEWEVRYSKFEISVRHPGRKDVKLKVKYTSL